MIETELQHKEIMPFFCKREESGGLGYRETEPNIVTDDLFIPSQLAEFVKSADPQTWKALLSNHRGNEQELALALKNAIKDGILESSNVAVWLNAHKNFTFEGETVPLWFVSGTELGGDADFRKNIFAAVEEMPHKVKCDGVTLQTIRPDIAFFLNGIYIGYMELKSVTNGQTAKMQGRGKVIGDYLESVKGMAVRAKAHPAALGDRRETLWLFEKGIHLTATDVNETYVIRSIGTVFDDALKGFVEQTATVAQFRPGLEKAFKPYPITSELLSNKQRFVEVMHALYAKKMIEREILYYNFLRYKYKDEGKGKKKRKVRVSHRGTPISPRPKQKFGCDRILGRVREMLEHEKEPDFYRERLKRALKALGVTAEKLEGILADRDRYCNNKYVYSLLLQYAAGFGKSNIIGWTALQLKDLRHEGAWAFDKVMIVVDRLQLRDQIDTMMMSMNIDKGMFTEVTNQDELISALTGGKRIVVVNIQKFLELQNALDKADRTLKRMRVAFLIDEIHRSNTGDSNREMVNLFEKLQDGINGAAAQGGGKVYRKNLIVGFTATPTEKVLARFGEFKSASIIPTWVPFDAYTMQEAIADGYVLDPTKHIIPVVSKISFETPPEYDPNDENQSITIDKSKIYGNEDRMEQIAHFIVNRLVSLVYGKIHGTGKAMLAVSSIPLAIRYCNLIRKKMSERCAEPLYKRYASAPVSIVYSDSQECESSASMNGGESEAKVIQDFKNAKNGLMIVVDKLQTGFDEPKLHTLFLDKEIQGINAIQTISRVNRTCKYKEECHVVDLSWRNVNVENIREAFRKYCGINVSGFNPEQEALVVKMLYGRLCASEPFVRWFAECRRRSDDPQFMLQMEDGIRQWIRVQFERTRDARAQGLKATDSEFMQVVNVAKELRKTVGRYAASIKSLEGVLDIAAKYTEYGFQHFWEIYCRIYRAFMQWWGANDPSRPLHPEVEGDDEIPGITVEEEAPSIDEDGDGDEDDGGEGAGGKEKRKQDILAVIKAWNDAEQLTQAEVEKWLAEIGELFKWLSAQEKFMAVIRDSVFTPDMKLAEYTKVLKVYKFLLNKRTDLVRIQLFKKLLEDNGPQLLDVFMQSLPGVEAQEYSFDFAGDDDDEMSMAADPTAGLDGKE